ncbi:MAG: hypothetical protein BWY79_00254 [Actinobacteria bacterium ADurb.Bin444]|nr:MAG: hypothetical protein BWY79_00254 [Actinobacteria bacterium ADurb.Bin444]
MVGVAIHLGLNREEPSYPCQVEGGVSHRCGVDLLIKNHPHGLVERDVLGLCRRYRLHHFGRSGGPESPGCGQKWVRQGGEPNLASDGAGENHPVSCRRLQHLVRPQENPGVARVELKVGFDLGSSRFLHVEAVGGDGGSIDRQVEDRHNHRRQRCLGLSRDWEEVHYPESGYDWRIGSGFVCSYQPCADQQKREGQYPQ